MKRIMVRNPDFYKVGYLYTSQYDDEVLVIKAIEVYKTGLSFPVYFLHCAPAPGATWRRLVRSWRQLVSRFRLSDA